MTLVSGLNQFEKNKLVARVHKDGKWIEGEPIPRGSYISIYPTLETVKDKGIRHLQRQLWNDESSMSAVQNLVLSMYRSIKDNCTELDSNLKLVDFSSKIEHIDHIRKYDEQANREMEHGRAKTAERVLTAKLEVSS